VLKKKQTSIRSHFSIFELNEKVALPSGIKGVVGSGTFDIVDGVVNTDGGGDGDEQEEIGSGKVGAAAWEE
jgi:hypothetical protein